MSITPGDNDPSALDLVQALINPASLGSTSIINPKVSSHFCKGFFSNGKSVTSDFPDTGVVLGTGLPESAEGPDDSESEQTNFGTPGDEDLEGLLGDGDYYGWENYDGSYFDYYDYYGNTVGRTFDACVLEFDIVCPTECNLLFNYVFGSEEYLEFVGSEFNDVFGLFVDDENIALLPYTNTVVSINTVNSNSNADFFIANENYDSIQADGFTTRLTASKTLGKGTFHVKFAVADVADEIYDTWLFLQGQTLQVASMDATSILDLLEGITVASGEILPVSNEVIQNPPAAVGNTVFAGVAGAISSFTVKDSFTSMEFVYSSKQDLIVQILNDENVLVDTYELKKTDNDDCSSTGKLCDWVKTLLVLPGAGKKVQVTPKDSVSVTRGRALQGSLLFAFLNVQITAVIKDANVGGKYRGKWRLHAKTRLSHFLCFGSALLPMIQVTLILSLGGNPNATVSMESAIWSWRIRMTFMDMVSMFTCVQPWWKIRTRTWRPPPFVWAARSWNFTPTRSCWIVQSIRTMNYHSISNPMVKRTTFWTRLMTSIA